jgi:predicted Zn-dependent peptidase
MTATRAPQRAPGRRLLDNGVPVLTRYRPGSPVTTVSLWVLRGSRHEATPGITHLLEHVLMQATPPGRALRVVDELESCGGEANAVTARDHLALYARVPTPDAPAALAVLADALATGADFPAELVDAERRVVDEELRLAAADPTDVVHDVFFAAAFGDHPVGRPVGGEPGAVADLGPADLAAWAREHIVAGQVAAVVAGDLDPDLVADLLAAGPLGTLPPGDGSPAPGEDGPRVSAGRGELPLNSDTAALILGGPGFALTDPRLPAAEVLMELLAGANSSVLNEEIRSVRGLSYDVWGTASGYRDTGVWRVGCSCAPEQYDEVAELARTLVVQAVERGWSAEQVATARRRVAGLLRLDTESSLDDALLLGRYALVGGDPEWSPERHVEALAAVDAAAVDAAGRVMCDELVVAGAGGSPPEESGQRWEVD